MKVRVHRAMKELKAAFLADGAAPEPETQGGTMNRATQDIAQRCRSA